MAFHCTGQNLTSFFECQLYPSSITMHETILEVGGTIQFIGQPAQYGGTWSQPSPEHLSMTYTDTGVPVAHFEGDATTTGCFEGITTFPGSSWVSAYLVCP